MGKTALGLNIAYHAAVHQKRGVAVFSLEMSREALLVRLLCQAARVNSYCFRSGLMTATDRQRLAHAAAFLYNLTSPDLRGPGIHIDDAAGLTAFDIHSRVLRLRVRQPVELVIVDYLQLMSPQVQAENKNLEVSAITKALKQTAKDLRVPVVVLAQLTRECEKRSDKRPMLLDLRDSGSIEQDADVVTFLFREEVYKPGHEELHGAAELICRKQRNGPIGTVPLIWLAEFTKFENRAVDLKPEQTTTNVQTVPQETA